MDLSQERINALLEHPSESLAIEIKSWIDPVTTDGIAKIAKATLGLRNSNGGYLIIGVDDKTLLPSQQNIPSDVRASFHLDVIQGIVSRYASSAFEVYIGFAERDRQIFPVIGVPEGIRVPVACKGDLKNTTDKYLLREGAVYFRTLGANGTPSTSSAKPSDWSAIVEICFDNREADIGRFIRRHIGGRGIQELLGSSEILPKTLEQKTIEFDERISRLRVAAIKDANLEEKVDGLGSWSVAFLIDPLNNNAQPNEHFLNTLAGANPNYTGWPVWLDSRGFANTKARPHKKGKAWEAILASPDRSIGAHFDYQYMDAKGEFYQWRVLQDDLTNEVEMGTALDPTLVVWRVTETIAVGLAFAKALKFEKDSHLGFYFKWQNIKGRTLKPWVDHFIYFSYERTAFDNEIRSFVSVPIETASSSIAPYVREATRDLFGAFDGFEYSLEAIEQWVSKVLSRSR